MTGSGTGGYLAAAGFAEAEVREKGSRFRAFVVPAASEEEAGAALAELARRFPDATHHCWAWRLGDPPRERSSDAGEPRDTAGPPILQAVRSAGLSDALAVVVRWFGGNKLGKGGLARAYGAAAREAVAATPAARRVPSLLLALEVSHERVGAVRRLLRPPAIELAEEAYGERARLVLRVRADHREAVEEALAGLGVALAKRGPS